MKLWLILSIKNGIRHLNCTCARVCVYVLRWHLTMCELFYMYCQLNVCGLSRTCSLKTTLTYRFLVTNARRVVKTFNWTWNKVNFYGVFLQKKIIQSNKKFKSLFWLEWIVKRFNFHWFQSLTNRIHWEVISQNCVCFRCVYFFYWISISIKFGICYCVLN